MKSTEQSAVSGIKDSNVLGTMSDSYANTRSRFMLTSDLRHFIDMVYLYASQKGFMPSYVSRADFKNAIDEMRRFEMSGRADGELFDSRVVISKEAYSYALIVYGFVKELAAAGSPDANRAYDALKQLMPYKM